MSASLRHWNIPVPIAIAATIVGAVILRWVLRRSLDHLIRGLSDNALARRVARARAAHDGDDTAALIAERTAARARTVASLLKSIVTFVLASIALIIVLSLLGIDITPVIASAGVVGVAVGFGAQSLIRDFLTGVFMILEDQYGVGDVIDTGQASGIVEEIGLRVTKLRDDNGVLWYVPHGSIQRVGNRSQGWAVANVEVPVAYTEDLGPIQELCRTTAELLATDGDWDADILDVPAVVSVESMTPDAVLLRVQLRTQPLRQNDVARELRLRLKAALDAGGVSYQQGPRHPQ